MNILITGAQGFVGENLTEYFEKKNENQILAPLIEDLNLTDPVNSLAMVKTIHAFEPIPKTFNYLLKHIELNDAKKIITNNFALSESNGEVEFLWHDKELGASSMVNIRELENIKKIKCKTMKLDDYVVQKKIKVDFIKCDVEGSELLIFKGAKNVLKDSQPIIFC